MHDAALCAKGCYQFDNKTLDDCLSMKRGVCMGGNRGKVVKDMGSLDKQKTMLSKEYGRWTSDPFNTSFVYEESYSETVKPFVACPSRDGALHLPMALGAISTWHMMQFQHGALNEEEYHNDHLAHSVLLDFYGQICKYGARASKVGGRQKFCHADFITFARLMALGWKDHAQYFAQTAVKMDDMELVSDFLEYESLPLPLEWVSFLLMRDWASVILPLDCDPTILTRMGPYGHLLEVWRDPDLEVFEKALVGAADQHVTDCGRDDVLFPITKDQYWLWPVELFAICQARRLGGLPLPQFQHPLFTQTPLGALPDITQPPVPDPRIATALGIYQEISGHVVTF